MAETLAAGLKSASIQFETLEKHYHPMLALVKELIGVVPSCDPILEIWPVGFRSYNILVPNMFNLPATIFGNKSFKANMGLAMYISSRAAECPYCSAHTASFALRRGATEQALSGELTAKEQAVVTVAESLSRVPAILTKEECDTLNRFFSSSEAESIVFSISMMGFLNKFMDAIGVELEQEAINDTAELISKTGWTPGKHIKGPYQITEKTTPKVDNLFTYLRVIKQAPFAIQLEKKWTKGVPNSYPDASEFLKKHTGYSFPILKYVGQKRVILALTTVLRDNLDKEATSIGLTTKSLVGYIFAEVVSNPDLGKEVRQMTNHFSPTLGEEVFALLDKFAREKTPTDVEGCQNWMDEVQKRGSLTEIDAAVLLLARAASPSPAQVNEAVIDATTPLLSPEGVVETIVWLSVLQLLHRLGSYYALVKGTVA